MENAESQMNETDTAKTLGQFSSHGFFDASDGLQLHYHACLNDSAEYQLIALHGLGEHSGRYKWFAEQIAQSGGNFLCLDLRGHGKSQGLRGHSPSYEQLLDDLARFIKIQAEQSEQKNIPTFLLGHSLGGGIAINYTLQEEQYQDIAEQKIQGLIALSPLLKLSFQPPAWKLFLARKLVKLMPSFSLKRGIKPWLLTRNKAILADQETDPLMHDMVSAALTLGFLENGEKAVQIASQLETPTLLLHGEEDQVTSIDASKEFAAGTKDVLEFNAFKDCFHELLNEPTEDRTKVSQTICQWISKRLQAID